MFRVSVKTLALTCMCEVITQNPQVWNLPVSLEETDLFTTGKLVLNESQRRSLLFLEYFVYYVYF